MRIIYIITLVLFISCSDNSSEDNGQYDELIKNGWELFSGKNYDDAIKSFKKAKDENSKNHEAYLGLAWSNLLSPNILTFDDAVLNSNEVISRNPNIADAYASLAFAKNLQKKYTESNTAKERTLEIDSKWKFSKRINIDSKKLDLLSAQNYFFLAEYVKSINLIKKLNPDFNANVNTQTGIFLLQNEIERLNPSL